jgi:organic hydroperoxide reductase OsmC/OhrA
MLIKEVFKLKTKWISKKGESTLKANTFSRNHTVTIKGKGEPLKLSSAKIFKGDDTLYNPEDLLLSALSSCHMMSYFYVCSQKGVELLSYEDKAKGFLEVDKHGKGQFIKVVLNLEIVVSHREMVALAESLHEQASELCFIANSCSFPIEYQCVVSVK